MSVCNVHTVTVLSKARVHLAHLIGKVQDSTHRSPQSNTHPSEEQKVKSTHQIRFFHKNEPAMIRTFGPLTWKGPPPIVHTKVRSRTPIHLRNRKSSNQTCNDTQSLYIWPTYLERSTSHSTHRSLQSNTHPSEEQKVKVTHQIRFFHKDEPAMIRSHCIEQGQGTFGPLTWKGPPPILRTEVCSRTPIHLRNRK